MTRSILQRIFVDQFGAARDAIATSIVNHLTPAEQVSLSILELGQELVVTHMSPVRKIRRVR